MDSIIEVHCLSKIKYVNRNFVSTEGLKERDNVNKKLHVTIVLNGTAISKIFVTNLGNSALVILADGAINALVNLYKTLNEDDQKYVLQELGRLSQEGRFIHTGDMDTSKSENIDFFKRLPGFLSVKNDCQITTDFEKSLDYMNKFIKDKTGLDTSLNHVQTLIIYGGVGGPRFDLTIATLHTVTKLMRKDPQLTIINYNDEGILIGLNKSMSVHLLDVDEYKSAVQNDTLYSGYFSLDGSETIVSTKGFEYDVTDETFTFGQTWISTCNSVKGNTLTFLRYEGPPGFLYIQQLPVITATTTSTTT